jgi:hypothetical protein
MICGAATRLASERDARSMPYCFAVIAALAVVIAGSRRTSVQAKRQWMFDI